MLFPPGTMKRYPQIHRSWLPLCLGLLLLLLAAPATAQELDRNRRAEREYEEGMAHFSAGRYEKAAKAFDAAGRYDLNQVTEASLYMSGLSQYFQKDFNRALLKFQQVVTNFPRGRYAEDAQYHKGLIMLKKPGSQAGGLFVLKTLANTASTAELKNNARNAVLHYLYKEASLAFLEEYLEQVKAKKEDLQMVREAYAWRLHANRNHDELYPLLTQWQQDGELSDRLRKLLPPQPKKPARKEELKIAVCLPYNVLVMPERLQDNSRKALEVMAGIRMALRDKAYPGFDKIEVHFFDTRQSQQYTSDLMRTVVADYAPDVIIGGIYNGPSREMALYADKHQIPHLVPLSPTEKLLTGVEHSFLMTPTLPTQARYTADFVLNRTRMRKIMLVNDGSALSQQMAKAFREALKDSPVDILEQRCANIYGVEQLHKTMRQQRCDGLFMPVFKETVVNFMFTLMYQDSLPVQLIGLQEWQHLTGVEQRYLYHFELLFPSNFHQFKDTAAYRAFERAYIERYRSRPSREVLVGYDVIQAFLHAYGRFREPIQASTALQKAPRFKGLQNDFYFNGEHTNQALQMLRFTKKRLVKAEEWEEVRQDDLPENMRR